MGVALLFRFQIADMHVYRIFGNAKKRRNFDYGVFDVKNSPMIKLKDYFLVFILRRNRPVFHNHTFYFHKCRLNQFVCTFRKIFPKFR